jgi:hypothetical protein
VVQKDFKEDVEMRKTLPVVCIILILAASLAVAKTPPKSWVLGAGKSGPGMPMAGYFEGFEGAFPPAGWSQIITVPTNTWMRDVDGLYPNPYEGAVAAYIPWQADTTQYEVLKFEYKIGPGEDHLNFATMGSPYWAPNATLTVEIDGVEVWSFEDYGTLTFVYEIFDIDLSGYDGQTVEIAFIYSGTDGADHYLDAVGVNEGYTPPPPPENDTCEGAIGIPYGAFSIDATTDLANDDYDPYDYVNYTSCTGYTAAGADVVYCITLLAGDSFEVTMDTGGLWDDSIYLITDCDDPVNTCVIGDDQYPDGSGFVYTATATGQYYLIVDAYSGGGAFNISGVNGGGPSSAEQTTWGGIKSLYR